MSFINPFKTTFDVLVGVPERIKGAFGTLPSLQLHGMTAIDA